VCHTMGVPTFSSEAGGVSPSCDGKLMSSGRSCTTVSALRRTSRTLAGKLELPMSCRKRLPIATCGKRKGSCSSANLGRLSDVASLAKSADSSANGLCSVIRGHGLRRTEVCQPRRVSGDSQQRQRNSCVPRSAGAGSAA
jgi:hypothetical protein